jgi:hypothetical protein
VSLPAQKHPFGTCSVEARRLGEGDEYEGDERERDVRYKVPNDLAQDPSDCEVFLCVVAGSAQKSKRQLGDKLTAHMINDCRKTHPLTVQIQLTKASGVGELEKGAGQL